MNFQLEIWSVWQKRSVHVEGAPPLSPLLTLDDLVPTNVQPVLKSKGAYKDVFFLLLKVSTAVELKPDIT